MMIAYNVLSGAASNEKIGDDDLFLVENLDPKDKIVADKKVGYEVEFEKDEILVLDDCSIDLRPD
jgi:hypothetical protein